MSEVGVIEHTVVCEPGRSYLLQMDAPYDRMDIRYTVSSGEGSLPATPTLKSPLFTRHRAGSGEYGVRLSRLLEPHSDRTYYRLLVTTEERQAATPPGVFMVRDMGPY